MDLKEDKQKIYSIEAEYYREQMKETSQVSISKRLNNIINLLMITLLLIILFFTYKMLENNTVEVMTPTHLNKKYIEELAIDNASNHSVSENIVMGVSIVSPQVEVTSVGVSVSSKKIDVHKKSISINNMDDVMSEKAKIFFIKKKMNPVSNVEKKLVPKDILSVEYLNKMKNALKNMK